MWPYPIKKCCNCQDWIETHYRGSCGFNAILRAITVDPYERIPEWCPSPVNKKITKSKPNNDSIDWEKVAKLNPELLH
ncbi:MAG: hypothetical protein JRJ39_00405 [Deltaproteobacteria bacterium]|nr:hypothetical protein [Deltaproteobacteria bacterium]MBW1845569.1 hypothetical protein [Deltaproteobacteria bacterium]